MEVRLLLDAPNVHAERWPNWQGTSLENWRGPRGRRGSSPRLSAMLNVFAAGFCFGLCFAALVEGRVGVVLFTGILAAVNVAWVLYVRP